MDAAHRAGIGVDAEARHVSAMRTAVRAGVDRLHVVFAASPLSEYSDEDMRLLVRGAKPVALGPSSNILRGPYFVSTMEMRQSYVRVLDFPEILDHPLLPEAVSSRHLRLYAPRWDCLRWRRYRARPYEVLE